MITQVSSLRVGASIARDPRRKAQSVQFKNNSKLPYTGDFDTQHSKERNDALWSSVEVVAGSILFVAGYFVLSALSNLKK